MPVESHHVFHAWKLKVWGYGPHLPPTVEAFSDDALRGKHNLQTDSGEQHRDTEDPSFCWGVERRRRLMINQPKKLIEPRRKILWLWPWGVVT